MINKHTARVLSERLPLAMVSLSPDIIDMLSWKWGRDDDLFHSIKATVKRFKKFKDVDIRTHEDRAMILIEEMLTRIYACPNCQTDIRKCEVIRRTRGVESVELYISADGNQARTHHEKFESDGGIDYNCMGCGARIHNNFPIYDFLKRGIHRSVCIDYLHRNHPNVVKGKKKTVNGLEPGDIRFVGDQDRPFEWVVRPQDRRLGDVMEQMAERVQGIPGEEQINELERIVLEEERADRIRAEMEEGNL